MHSKTPKFCAWEGRISNTHQRLLRGWRKGDRRRMGGVVEGFIATSVVFYFFKIKMRSKINSLL